MSTGEDHRDFVVIYAGGDRPWALWIAALLEQEGFRVELDELDWAPELDAVERMNLALERADRVLALWSPRYFDSSSWALWELSAAMLNPARQGRLVPVMIERVQLEPLLEQLTRIDVSGRSRADAARELLGQLRHDTGRGQHPFPGSVLFPGAPFPAATPPVWRVPPRNPHFTGREALLGRMHAELSTEKTVVVQALHGMGGVGKTQLAIEYAYRYASEYELVWWFDAERTELVFDQFSQLAERLGFPADLPGPEAVAAVLEALSSRDRWLLVFDNITDPAALMPFRRFALIGRVLVTSRHPDWEALGSRIELDVFAREEGVALLKRRLPEISTSVADSLAGELGDLPLALELALGYIESTQTSPERYLSRFRTIRESPLGPDSLPDQGLLDAASALSLERLAEDAPAALLLLEISAFLAPRPAPTWLFAAAARFLPDPLDDAVADELTLDGLRTLTTYALMSRTDTGYQVHRLVQGAVRRTLVPEQGHALAQLALATLQAALPDREFERPDAWPAWQVLLPHVLVLTDEFAAQQSDAEGVSWLLDAAARYLQARGEPMPARPLLERALAVAEATYGPEHPIVGAHRNNLGILLQNLGDLAGAREQFAPALAIAEAAYGPDHPAVGTARSNLGTVLSELGELPDTMASVTVATLERRLHVAAVSGVVPIRGGPPESFKRPPKPEPDPPPPKIRPLEESSDDLPPPAGPNRRRAWRSMAVLGLLAGAVGLGVVEVIRWLLGSTVEVDRPERAVPADLVDFTVFAPPAAAAGKTVMVQVFAHLPAAAAEAHRVARELDRASRLRGYRTLEVPVSRGERLTFELRMPGCDIETPVDSVIWRGSTQAAQFLVTLPAAPRSEEFFGTMSVSVAGVPAGHVRFKLEVTAARTEHTLAPVGDVARRYTAAFVSYASADRDAVLRRVQMLTALEIDFFQDVFSLKPGDRWERRIECGLDQCDLFLLFWSRAAKESQWVRREVAHALKRKGSADADADPEIRPVILDDRPVPEPWELSHLHFNDHTLYVLSPHDKSAE